jgi:hypothetical protein
MRRPGHAMTVASGDGDGELTGLHDGLLTFPAAVGFERWLPSRRHILKTYSDFT